MALRALAAAEAFLLGLGLAVLLVAPPPASDGEVAEAPPVVAIPQSAFRLPDIEAVSVGLDVNTASEEDLAQALSPGVARLLVRHRTEHGPFRSVADLDAVSGIGPATLEKILPHITIGGVPASTHAGATAAAAGGGSGTGGKVNINTASAAELEALPGIGALTAAKIIAGRPYASVDDLDRVQGVGKRTIERLRPLVTVN